MFMKIIRIVAIPALLVPAAASAQSRSGDGANLPVAPVRPPAIVSDRPAREDPLPAEVAPRDESIVQIHGRWVEFPGQCVAIEGDPPPGALYVTDTLIQWREATCSVRDVEKTEKGARVTAYCVSEDGRSRDEIVLTRDAPDRMRFSVKGDPAIYVLQRCPQ